MLRSSEKGKKSKTSPEYLPKKYQELIEYHSQKPYFAEPYRTLRSNLHLFNSHTPIKTLLVTSSEPAEGKTTILVNLAISFSEEGKSVLIIDSDVRKPKIQKFFEIESHPGLTEILLVSVFFFSSRRRHTRLVSDWSSDVCSSDLMRRHTRLVSDWSSDVCSSDRSEEHTSELQSLTNLVCRLLLRSEERRVGE